MGMDVYGNNPKNEQGEYFRSNVWYWHPLWDCLDQLHPTLCQKCESPHDNSGSGLNSRDATALSKLLKKGEIEHSKIGRRIFIDKVSLNEYLQKQKCN